MPSQGLWLLLVSTFIITAQGFSQPPLNNNRGPSQTLTPPCTSSTALSVFFANENDKKLPSKKNNIAQNATSSNSNADLLQTLQLKDEALGQAQRAVSSLESALESAVSNLETMQQQLQRQVKELDEQLKNTKGELASTKTELETVKLELSGAQEELQNVNDARDGLEWALGQSQEEARKAEERVEQLEAYLADMGVDASSVKEKKVEVRSPIILCGVLLVLSIYQSIIILFCK
jgi:chromosome segregation ATPase